MNTKLQHLFTHLEADRRHLVERVKILSPDALKRAQPGKWSIQEILAHLIASERLSIQYVNKKILGISETRNTGLWEEFKMKILQLSQRMPLKFKAPRFVVDLTPSYASIEQLSADWQTVREELRLLLEKFDDTQIRKKVYKHTRAGRLNIQQLLLFFREHIIHHTPQIEKLMNDRA